MSTIAQGGPLDSRRVADTGRRYVADVVVTMDADNRILRPGAIEVIGDRIVSVGPASAGASDPAIETVAVGGLLMPGLVNTHGHSAMTLLRGAGDGLPLDRWLSDVIWPREAQLSADDVYWGTLLGCGELLRAGVTATCEQYMHARAVAEAALESGIRCVLTPAVFDLPGGGPDATWQRQLEDAGEVHAELHGRDGRMSVGIGPHSAYALPEEGLVAVAKLATELDTLVHIHVAETRSEDEDLRRRLGCSAPELLARLGVLECRVLAAHSVWLSDGDFDLYGAFDVAVAHCPQSNAKLGSGIADVSAMLARGLRVGLGTDGPASNDNLDLWEEMRLAPLLARATACDAGALGMVDALRLATVGGAGALYLETGSLETGRIADFIRLDLDDAAFTPGASEDAILAHLVWAASSRHVTDVWVGGRRVVEKRRCTMLDEAEARHQVVHRARHLVDT